MHSGYHIRSVNSNENLDVISVKLRLFNCVVEYQVSLFFSLSIIFLAGFVEDVLSYLKQQVSFSSEVVYAYVAGVTGVYTVCLTFAVDKSIFSFSQRLHFDNQCFYCGTLSCEYVFKYFRKGDLLFSADRRKDYIANVIICVGQHCVLRSLSSFSSAITQRILWNRAFCLIFLIWSAALLAAAPYGFVLQINYLQHPETGEDLMESAWCGPPKHDESMFDLIVASTSIFFVIPMFLLGFAYWRIGRTLEKSEKRYRLEDMRMGSSSSEHSRGGMQSRRSIIRMLCEFVHSLICIIIFSCCITWANISTELWLTFHVQYNYRDLFLQLGCA